MKLIIASPGLDPKDRRMLEHELNRAIPGIKKRLPTKDTQSRILRARATSEGTPENPRYHLTLAVQIRHHPIISQKSGTDLRLLVNSSEEALRRELRKHGAKIRREHLRRRRDAAKESFERFSREVAQAEAAAPAPVDAAPEASLLFARLRPILGQLYNYAREHIRAAVVAGEIPTDYFTADDLVDQAIIRVLERHESRVGNPNELEHTLYRHIDAVLEEEIARRAPEAENVSLDGPSPDAFERWTIGRPEEEEAEFFQPFEALRLEDVLIDDHAIDPEHAMSELEEHRLILKHLTPFHSKARSAFFLNRMEGFETYEIAMIQNRQEEAVRNDIEACVKALREEWIKLHGWENGRRTEQSNAV